MVWNSKEAPVAITEIMGSCLGEVPSNWRPEGCVGLCQIKCRKAKVFSDIITNP